MFGAKKPLHIGAIVRNVTITFGITTFLPTPMKPTRDSRQFGMLPPKCPPAVPVILFRMSSGFSNHLTSVIGSSSKQHGFLCSNLHTNCLPGEMIAGQRSVGYVTA